jgi:hypothetical protein
VALIVPRLRSPCPRGDCGVGARSVVAVCGDLGGTGDRGGVGGAFSDRGLRRARPWSWRSASSELLGRAASAGAAIAGRRLPRVVPSDARAELDEPRAHVAGPTRTHRRRVAMAVIRDPHRSLSEFSSSNQLTMITGVIVVGRGSRRAATANWEWWPRRTARAVAVATLGPLAWPCPNLLTGRATGPTRPREERRRRREPPLRKF